MDLSYNMVVLSSVVEASRGWNFYVNSGHGLSKVAPFDVVVYMIVSPELLRFFLKVSSSFLSWAHY
jgi:hypothetical protein